MKIFNRLAVTNTSHRSKVIEGKNVNNFQKQCGFSKSNVNIILQLMSTFTTIAGLACFITNLINSKKQEFFKQAYPGLVRYQLNSLIGFGIILSFLGMVQLYFQSKKKSKFYLASQVLMIPFAFSMIILSSIFYDRVYFPIEYGFTQQECQTRVQRVLGENEQLFSYYEEIYHEFCSESCPCKIEDESQVSLSWQIYKGNNELWSNCQSTTKIQINEQYNQLLEKLEDHYQCAGLCEKHEYYLFIKNDGSLPHQSCIQSLTEEFNLISQSTIAINVITSTIILLFIVLFLSIRKKIFYIWDYQIQKKQQNMKKTEENKNQVQQGNQQQNQQKDISSNNLNQSVQSSSSKSTKSCNQSYDGLQPIQNNQEVTRIDVCDWKDECERLEKLIEQLKQKQSINQNEQQDQLSSNNLSELEQVVKQYENASRIYQTVIRNFQQQQKQSQNPSLTDLSDQRLQQEQPQINQQDNIKQDQVIINISQIEQTSNIDQQQVAINEVKQENIQLPQDKQKIKTELTIIEEEIKQFDSVC